MTKVLIDCTGLSSKDIHLCQEQEKIPLLVNWGAVYMKGQLPSYIFLLEKWMCMVEILLKTF